MENNIRNNSVKAALFDLDGVVVDTEGLYSQFWGGIFHRYYPDSPELAQQIKGSTLVEILDRWFGDSKERQNDVVSSLNDFEAHMPYSYIAGFPEFITRLRKAGVLTAVVTSSNVPKMQNVYRCHPELKGWFDAILTAEDFAESKPSPDCYLRAMKRLGVNAGESCVLEDSFNGLRSGRASGAYVLGLATTNSAESIAPLADRVISNYIDLPADVERLFGIENK